MKRAWTRSEKWLWATPLLIGIFAGGALLGPEVVRRATGRPQILAIEPDAQIRSMALSRNGEILAAGGSVMAANGWGPGSGTVHLWNARTAEKLKPIAPIYTRDRRGFVRGYDIYALVLSPDGKQIGFARSALDWELYDVATQTQLWSFHGPTSVAEFSPDGRFVAFSSETHISIVNSADGKMQSQWKRPGHTDSQDLAWSPDSTLVASIGPNKTGNPIELHQANTGKLVHRIQSSKTAKSAKIVSVAFSPDSKQLIVACFPGSFHATDNFSMFASLRCYSAVTGKPRWEAKTSQLGGTSGFYAAFCDAIFSPDGRVIAAYQNMKNQVQLLDSRTGAVKATLRLGKVPRAFFYVPPGLAFSPDGKRLFVRDMNSILLRDLE